ncbi:MAG TPA: hypothetical protein VMG12_04215 [Polyangiaceae bacterium]|nr:hypothetical protein [Polyangiaceae bacterium]
MKRLSFVLALCVAWFGAISEAGATEVGRGRDFGIGVAFGSPTSIVGKYFIGGGNALDFGLGFWTYGWGCNNRGFCEGRSFDVVTFNADYLWQDGIVAGSKANLDWHIGAGGRVWVGGGDASVAARMPVGLDLTFRKPSFLEVYLEIAPAMYVVPGLYLDLEAALGVRFYF